MYKKNPIQHKEKTYKLKLTLYGLLFLKKKIRLSIFFYDLYCKKNIKMIQFY